MTQQSAQYRIIIPTRDSARHVAPFLNAFREYGVEPLYIVNTATVDGTGDLLRAMKADVIDFTPSAEYVEAGFQEFAAQKTGTKWILRLDDDEFPSRAMLRWIAEVGCRSLNPGWIFSRHELFQHDGQIWTSRRPGRYNNARDADFLSAQGRLYHVDRVSYSREIHTSGFANLPFFGDAPKEAFFIHCNCLLRSAAERLQKIYRAERIKPLSNWRVGDEYLPEAFEFESHHAGRDGLEQFENLFRTMPIPEDLGPPELPPDERLIMEREIAKLVSNCRAAQSEYATLKSKGEALLLANEFEWLRVIPRNIWQPLGELLCTLGHKRSHKIGTAIWNYANGVYFRSVSDYLAAE